VSGFVKRIVLPSGKTIEVIYEYADERVEPDLDPMAEWCERFIEALYAGAILPADFGAAA
jgi:hypothetical protein